MHKEILVCLKPKECWEQRRESIGLVKLTASLIGRGRITKRHSYAVSNRSALDYPHLGREGLRWNDGQLMTCYT